MLNIKLPDYSELTESEKNILNLVGYSDIIKNCSYEEFKLRPEILEFRKNHPKFGVFLYSNFMVEKTNYGQRTGNTKNGTKEEQRMGILAQNVMAMYLKQPFVKEGDGFDGGHDYLIEGKKIDLKTCGRNFDLNMEYVHNLIGRQLDLDADFYLCASFNKKENLLQISALIPKEIVKLFWKHYDPSTMSYNASGKKIGGTDRYEVEDYLLTADFGVNTVDDIRKLSLMDETDTDKFVFDTTTSDIANCISKAEQGDIQAAVEIEKYKKERLPKVVDRSTIRIFELDFYGSKLPLRQRIKLIDSGQNLLDKIKTHYLDDRFDKYKEYVR